jgi:undecaprenyl-diphosphatase
MPQKAQHQKAPARAIGYNRGNKGLTAAMITFRAIALGIVQGLTEFIPVSSSAHLVIVRWLFGWSDPVLEGLSFDLSLHLGTLVALLAFFATEWVRLVRAGVASLVERRIGDDPDRQLAWFLVLGSIPAGVAGFLAEAKIEELFHSPSSSDHQRNGAYLAIAALLIVGGLALWAADHFGRQRRGIEQLKLGDVIVIGLAQALSVFPGVSRSGSTMMAGLALRLNRPAAAQFSFLLSTPIILAAGLKGVFNLTKQFQSDQLTLVDLQLFGVGFVASMVSGYFCIKFLLRFLQTHSTAVFAGYRCVLAGLIICVALRRG